MECKHEYKRYVQTDGGNAYYCPTCDDFFEQINTHIDKDKLYLRSAVFAGIVAILIAVFAKNAHYQTNIALIFVLISLAMAVIMGSCITKVWKKANIRRRR